MAYSDLSKRNKILLIAGIVLLVLLFLYSVYFLYVFFNQEQPDFVDTTTTENTNTSLQPSPPPIFSPETATRYIDKETFDVEQETREETQSLLVIARSFVERFGSYSSQTEFVSFDDIDQFTTARMGEWMNSYAEGLQKEYPKFGSYYAFDTKAISSEISVMTDTNAEVLFNTQRQEFTEGNLTPDPFYQEILLKLIQENGVWKVDGAYWR